MAIFFTALRSRQVVWLLLAPIVTVGVWLTFVVIGFPVAILRYLITVWVRLKDNEICSILSPRSSILGSDHAEWSTHPRFSIAVLVHLDGELSLSEWRRLILDRVVMTRSEGTKLVYPELQQFVVKRWGYLFFKPDPNFNIAHHVKEYESSEVTQKIDDDKLLEIWEDALTRPYQTNRSPWEVLLIPNYTPNSRTLEDGDELKKDKRKSKQSSSSVFIFRFHHSLADGVSVERLLLNMSDAGPDWFDKRFLDVKPDTRQNALFIVNGLVLGSASHFWNMFVEGGNAPNYIHSTEKFKRGDGQYHLHSAVIDVAKLKLAKCKYRVSFFSLITAGIAGGVRNYIRKQGVPVPESVVKLSFPILVPSHSKGLGNEWYSGFLTLPVTSHNPLERLRICHQRLSKTLHRGTVQMTAWATILVGLLPIWCAPMLSNILSTQQTVVYTGLILPTSESVKFASGTLRLKDVAAGIQVGNGPLGICCSVVTHKNEATVTLTLDKGTFPTRESGRQLMDLIVEEVDTLCV